MFRINLVPEVQQQKQNQTKRNTYATFFSVSLIVATISALVIMGAIKIGQDVSLNSTQTKIDSVKAESEEYKELEETVLSLEVGLNGAREILGGQNNWTKLLPHLEAATPSDVSFTKLEITGNTVTAELNGRDIESLSRFIQSYKAYRVETASKNEPTQNDAEKPASESILLFSNIETTRYSKEGSGVKFDAKFNFTEGILW